MKEIVETLELGPASNEKINQALEMNDISKEDIINIETIVKDNPLSSYGSSKQKENIRVWYWRRL